LLKKGAPPPTRQEGKPMELTDPVKRILGRNTFQRPKPEVLDMLGKIIKIYQRKD
jgi:hypothetical protein